MLAVVFANISLRKPSSVVPYGLVVRIRRSHRRGPGSIPGVGNTLVTIWLAFCACFASYFAYKAVLLSGWLAAVSIFYLVILRLCFCFVHCIGCGGI